MGFRFRTSDFFLSMMQTSLLSRAWYSLAQRSLQLVAAAAYHVRYSGRENIPATAACWWFPITRATSIRCWSAPAAHGG